MAFGLEEVRAEITSPRAESDPLIAAASFRACPSEPDFFSRSLPARSTKASLPREKWPVWRLSVETWMVTTRCDLDDAAFIFLFLFFGFFFGFFFLRCVFGGVRFFFLPVVFRPAFFLFNRFRDFCARVGDGRLRQGREGKKKQKLTSVADTRRLAAAETIVDSSSAADETRALAAPGTATVPVLGSRLISSLFFFLALLLLLLLMLLLLLLFLVAACLEEEEPLAGGGAAAAAAALEEEEEEGAQSRSDSSSQ